ncbi:MAG: M67 family metallopeptidase [Candidatus Xenobia bacterium]
MLKIDAKTLESIHAHARETYPHECCGYLVGTPGETRRATESVRATNLRTDRAQDRYEMDPLEWLRLEKRVGASGDAIVGIYHSHPDHPSRPSEFDREHAHPHMSYIIVATTKDGVASTQSWTLHPETRQFSEESVEIGS